LYADDAKLFRYITCNSKISPGIRRLRMVSLQTNGCRKNRKSTDKSDQKVQQLKIYSYDAILRRLNMPTLKYRRLQGDMIQVFNIVSGKYTTNPTVYINLSNVFNT